MYRLRLFLIALGLALTSTGLAADVLVTREGETVETQGAWKVKGRQVVFTNAQGVLSALRLADVDIEASTEATQRASQPALEEPARDSSPKEPTKKSVLSLTNADVARAGSAPGNGTAGSAPASPEAKKLRMTLGTIANGYSLRAKVNGLPMPGFSGGESQAVQLFHAEHANKAKMEADLVAQPDQDRNYLNLFCLREGENQLEIEFEPIEPASISPLRFYMNAPHYTLPILEFKQKERKAGRLATTFVIYSEMPADHQTQVLP